MPQGSRQLALQAGCALTRTTSPSTPRGSVSKASPPMIRPRTASNTFPASGWASCFSSASSPERQTSIQTASRRQRPGDQGQTPDRNSPSGPSSQTDTDEGPRRRRRAGRRPSLDRVRRLPFAKKALSALFTASSLALSHLCRLRAAVLRTCGACHLARATLSPGRQIGASAIGRDDSRGGNLIEEPWDEALGEHQLRQHRQLDVIAESSRVAVRSRKNKRI